VNVGGGAGGLRAKGHNADRLAAEPVAGARPVDPNRPGDGVLKTGLPDHRLTCFNALPQMIIDTAGDT
jgi:hypothetical protein